MHIATIASTKSIGRAQFLESFCPFQVEIEDLIWYFFLEPVTEIGNLKINLSIGPVHSKSTHSKNWFQFQNTYPLDEHKILNKIYFLKNMREGSQKNLIKSYFI